MWVDGSFSWIDGTWERSLRYKEGTLITRVTLKQSDLQLELYLEEGVHHLHDIFLRSLTVKNRADRPREVRVFLSFDIHVTDSDKGVTAIYYPPFGGVIHYKKDRYFLIGGRSEDGGLYQYAVGVIEFGDHVGAWKDAEDGDLNMNPVAHGSVDSVISVRFAVPASGESRGWFWIVAGKNRADLKTLRQIIQEETEASLLHEAEAYSRAWGTKSEIQFGAMPDDIVRMFGTSLHVLHSQIDARGAIIASCDSDILRFNRDTYSYMWPRDGALVAMGLDAAGYHQVTRRFFGFCRDLITDEGFLYQKYNPDGSWGSTWHPWIDREGRFQYPIQEDETALVLYSLWNHYDIEQDIEFIAPLYEPFVCTAADFLVGYRDPETGLPAPSYDLWEEKRGISTFTAAAVYGALQAAVHFADLFGDDERMKTYGDAAREVKEAILTHLFDAEHGRFCKMVQYDRDGTLQKDPALDSSVYGIFEFGVLPPGDARVVSTMTALESALWVKSPVGGMARYQDDYYQRVSDDIATVPGNPWPICTLWLADWYIANNKQLDRGIELMRWVANHASQARLIPEQVHPFTSAPLSVSPLTWSHSQFNLTVIRYLNLLNNIEICPSCGLPLHRKTHATHM
ncbi:MAG TPA: glycoside hydrolase family 15 protein [Methanoregulaceae archaeon]|nr:glycoside hydrolase family 15 protein [Methanoregulaceae archaeon]